MKNVRREKWFVAIVTVALVLGSVLGLNALIGHIQGKTIIESAVSKVAGNTEDGMAGQPFQVLISGLDDTGRLKKKERSDLNLLLTADPAEKKLLITAISRDTYLEKAGDKLVYRSCYGIDHLIDGVEELLGTKPDYWVQLNLSGFSTLIDAIGGVDVEAKKGFKTDWGPSFQKGKNHVDGKEALAFVRERHHLREGGQQRCVNQTEMLRAILDKLTEASVTEMDADALYRLWKDNVNTNMGAGEVLSLIRMQLSDHAKWDIETAVLKGKGKLVRAEKLASFEDGNSDAMLYVLEPNASSLEKIRQKIASVTHRTPPAESATP